MRIELHYRGIKNANIAIKELKLNGFTNTALDLSDNYIDMDTIDNYNSEINFSNIINSGGFPYNSHPGSPILGGFGSFRELENTCYKVIIDSDFITTDDISKLNQIVKETGGEIKGSISPSPSSEITEPEFLL
ncbi:hypothetical protein ACJDU8_12695 [Clostridium sp. WILCCON 0269]|uniref:General stress protein 17M-like domain-containing protein n=1 Tax=Candidatus Clostridium eludens TaxID=3381663 RepID=A0ABW8SKV9_9CLOT